MAKEEHVCICWEVGDVRASLYTETGLALKWGSWNEWLEKIS
jgi:hypothetical protein